MTTKEIKDILRGRFKNLAETLPDAALFDNLICYQDEVDRSTIYFIPLTISPEKGLQEKIQFNLIATGSTSFLQLAARWDIPRDVLKKLNQALLEKLKPQNITVIKFSVPPLTVEEVRLELADEIGQYTILQTSKSSGFFPFNTIFNCPVVEKQKDRILHVLNGTGNYLRVKYIASLSVKDFISAVLEGSISDIPDLQQSDIDETTIPDILQKAIADGILKLTTEGNGAKDLKDKVVQSALDNAAAALTGYTNNKSVNYNDGRKEIIISEGNLHVSAKQEVFAELKIEPEAEVSEWFGAAVKI